MWSIMRHWMLPLTLFTALAMGSLAGATPDSPRTVTVSIPSPDASAVSPDTGATGETSSPAVPDAAPAESSLQEPPAAPGVFLSFDTHGKTEHALVVEKSTHRLLVYEFDGAARLVAQYPCSTGRNGGPKAVDGDGKTPVGIYFFTRIFEDGELAPIYGVRAFPTDYPNVLDREAEHTGSAIWLHGTNKVLRPMESNGCVALKNEDLEKVTPLITLNRTPLIIAETLPTAPPESTTIEGERAARLVENWRRAIASGSYQDYVRLYDGDYVPDITWWKDWRKKRTELDKSGAAASVETARLAAWRLGNVSAVLFDLTLRAGNQVAAVGTKKLFLRHGLDEARIIGEEYQATEEPAGDPLVAAFRGLSAPKPEVTVAAARTETPSPARAETPSTRDDEAPAPAHIQTLVDQWLAAWSSKNIDAYGAYYADDFAAQGMNKRAWLEYKKGLNRKYDFIRVRQRNLSAVPAGETMTVSFVQEYESDGFKAVGRKDLVLKRVGDAWKIHRETWRKL